MRTRLVGLLLALVFFVSLTTFGQTATAGELEEWMRHPATNVPKLINPPTIDGSIDKAEWQLAAQMGPMLLLPDGVGDPLYRQIYVAYDDKNIYVAWRFDRPKHVVTPLIPDKTGHVDSWRLGDGCELMIDVGHTEKRYYGFVIYPNGAYSEGLGNPGMDRHWDCDWQKAARVTDRGWEGEAAIPFTSLELKGAPKAGDVWGFDVVDNQKTPFRKVGLNAFRGPDWHKYSNMGHLRFGDSVADQPIARVNHIGEGGDGMAEVAFELVNSTKASQDVSASVKIYKRKAGAAGGPKSYYDEIESGGDDAYNTGQVDFEKTTTLEGLIGDVMKKHDELTDLSIERTVVLANATRKSVGFNHKVGAGEYVVAYNFRDQSGAPLAAGVRVFKIEPPLAIGVKPYWLNRKILHVDADLRKVVQPTGSKLKFSIHGKEAGSKSLTEGEVTVQDTSLEGKVILSTADLSPGFYRVRAELTSPDGKEIAVNETIVEKPTVPVWHDNDLGMSLPEPWTPVVPHANGMVEVWGRSYDLSTVLPRTITSGGVNVLTSPIRFETASEGKAITWETKRVDIKEKDDTKAVFDVEMQSAIGTIAGEVKIEFDGLAWYDLKLTPKSNGVALDNLTLAIDFNPDYAELLNHHRFLHDPVISRSAPQPENHKREDSGRFRTIAIPFTCALWIGNEQLGMSWYAEAPVDWQNENVGGCIRVNEPKSKGAPAEMRMLFVDHPVKLNKPMRLKFGLQATPIRAMPDEDVIHCVQAGGPNLNEEYYKSIADAGGKSMIYHGGWKGDKMGDWGGWAAEPKDPAARQRVKDGIAQAHKHGLRVALYTGWGIHTESEEWKYFRYELTRGPLENSGFGTYRQAAGPDGAYADYMAYIHAMLMRDYGSDGVFWDSASNLSVDNNVDIGNGWVDDKGRARPAYPILGTRELFRRIYTLCHGEVKSGGLVVNFGGSVWCINAFADIFHRGEGTPMHVKTLAEAWQPLEDFRANYDARKIGVPYLSMNKNFKDLPMKVNHHTAVTLLHGTHAKSNALFFKYPHRLKYGENDMPMKHIWLARNWLPFDQDTIWHTYYGSGPQMVSLSPEHLLSSVFVSKDKKRALLVVSNIPDEAVKGATVQVNLKKLGLAGNVQAEDAILNQPIDISEGVIKLDIEPQRYRFLKLWTD